jgi:hypothetical protein
MGVERVMFAYLVKSLYTDLPATPYAVEHTKNNSLNTISDKR